MNCRMMNTASWLKFRRLVALGTAVMLGNATPAVAGTLHARSTLSIFNSLSICRPDGPIAADANIRGIFGRYRNSHEALNGNYTYGNAGSGHAHHHADGCGSLLAPPLTDTAEISLPPTIGSPGTSQYISQSWLPNAAGDEITVAWSPDNFLQLDLSDLTPSTTSDNPLASSASLAADGGLVGSVELLAWLDDQLIPQIDTHLTGIFDSLAFELTSYPGGVVSLQFRQPLNWTVPGDVETFDIALDGWINGVDVPESVPEPNTAFLFGTGLVGLLGSAWRRR